MCSPDQGMGAGVKGGSRRGRKRKQGLQGALADSRSLAIKAAEEAQVTVDLRKAEGSMKVRRRRVFR
ncbi:hypothetical protein AGOR_G00133260 [Albula goreensis]|uniref:Uncharacterized protein n=1 Tax=Albula goreensis TaxID=1534307 RepID=A0A8T3D471_9TELE|nr:hypothetical protein AGOR_G00133260 [Albula goreensis]